MKILILTNLFPPDILGGYEILCGQVREALERKGHQTTVLTSSHGKTGSTREVIRKLQLFLPFSMKATGKNRIRRLFADTFNYRITKEVLRKKDFDLALIFSQLRLTTGPARAVQEKGIPAIYSMNDYHIESYLPADPADGKFGRVKNWIDLEILGNLHIGSLDLKNVTCISRTVRRELISRGIRVNEATIIYQGIPVEQFPPKPVPGCMPAGLPVSKGEQPMPDSEPLKILYAGQLHEYKGVHTILESIQHLPEWLNTQITIAGNGPHEYKEHLKDLADQTGINVRFAGQLSHDELAIEYRNNHVFIFPSIWPEPFGLTHLEAMASGTTVISTTDGGHGEFLVDGENALTFSKADPIELAAAITRLCETKGLSESLACNARAMVEERFSMERYVDDLEAYCLEVAGGAR
jgi:glycosyltransferase involved in cell wall biosynthesis